MGTQCLDSSSSQVGDCQRENNQKCALIGHIAELNESWKIYAPPVKSNTLLAVLTYPGPYGGSTYSKGGYLTVSADGTVADSFSLQGAGCSFNSNTKSREWKIACNNGNNITGTVSEVKPGFFRGVGEDKKGQPYEVLLVKPEYLEKKGVLFETMPQKKYSTTNLSGMKDIAGCRLAVKFTTGKKPIWQTTPLMEKYVIVMKQRKFTLEDCAKIVGQQS